ncbi:hypothetical protein [Streptomyces sp. NBC_01235]|uniref:hypothetical protein n=1 Tax=Streptomyces sp. NBC_01235 TaxID=2903788 RepID=UPI002E132CE0|nr:hypothetical protein OG289_22550 [Streptomyces sp. NBC_01235]
MTCPLAAPPYEPPVTGLRGLAVAGPAAAADDADGAAYADAVSEYAALGRDELLEAARRCHGGYFGSRLNVAADQK